MTKRSLSPSPFVCVSDGQIGKVQGIVGAAMRKGRRHISKDVLQSVLQGDITSKGLVDNIQQTISNYAGIVRHVLVDYERSIESTLQGSGIKGRFLGYSSGDLRRAPKARTGKEIVEFVFFKPGYLISDQQVRQEFEARGLSVDVYAQATANADDPNFARHHPNIVAWKVEERYLKSLNFHQKDDRTYFSIEDDWVRDYSSDTWFGGARSYGTSRTFFETLVCKLLGELRLEPQIRFRPGSVESVYLLDLLTVISSTTGIDLEYVWREGKFERRYLSGSATLGQLADDLEEAWDKLH